MKVTVATQKDLSMKLIKLATALANAFVEERKAGATMKKELATVKAYVLELEGKLGEKSSEAAEAIAIMETGISFTPVADAMAEAAQEDPTVVTEGTAVETSETVGDNAEVTEPAVAEAIVENVIESVAKEEGIEVAPTEVAEVAEIAGTATAEEAAIAA